MAWKGFKGNPDSAAPLQPWVSPAPFGRSGVFLGIDLVTHERVCFDPWQWLNDGFIHSTIFRFTGEKKAGKTTAAKTIGNRLATMQAVDLNLQPTVMQIQFHDRKPENAQPDYKIVTEDNDGQVIDVQNFRLNLISSDMGLEPLDYFEIVGNGSELAAETKLRNFQPLALQIGIYQMLKKSGDIVDLGVLESYVAKLDLEDANEYFKASTDALVEQYKHELERRPELQQQLEINFQRPLDIPREEFRRDAALVAAYINRLRSAEFGNMFNGTRSPREIFQSNIVDINWLNVNAKAQTVLEAMLWRWREKALVTNDLALIPHLVIGDEEADAANNLMHARFQASFVARARASHTADIRISQFERQLRLAGDEGSELRQHSKNAAIGVGCRFYAAQPHDLDVMNDIAAEGIADADVEFMTTLPRGVFGIKPAHLPVRYYQHIVLPSEYAMIDSNSANRRMLQRTPIWTIDSINERAKRLGTKIGGVPIWDESDVLSSTV